MIGAVGGDWGYLCVGGECRITAVESGSVTMKGTMSRFQCMLGYGLEAWLRV